MDWDRLRQRWQHDAPTAPAISIDELRSLDRTIRKQVRQRDLLETVAAAVVAVFFGFTALGSAANGEWVASGFALLIAVWAVVVPLRLRHARRQMPEEEHRFSLMETLGRKRDAALAQARMLERVWLWYLTPPAIGVFGLTLESSGISTSTLVYLAAVLVFYAGVAWLNRHVARTKFRAHADQLQRQIDDLNGEAAE